MGGVSGGGYYLFSTETEDDIKVTGKLQISQQLTKFVNASSAEEPSYFAIVEGKIKNNLRKPIKNVLIKYTIGGQLTSATIFDLAPGQQLNFNTHGIKTNEPKPQFDFQGLYYD